MNIKQIVCPIDFSETSINAFRFAAELAKGRECTINLVHVYEKPYYSVASPAGTITYSVDPEANQELVAEIKKEFHKLEHSDFAKGLRIHSTQVSDVPAWKFFEEIRIDKADIIVMGTRGATGLLHGGLVGTNTERVIRHAPVPVISVPDVFFPRPIEKILFATDFNDPLDSIFKQILDLVKIYKTGLVLGMINTRENFATSSFANQEFSKLQKAFPDTDMKLVVHNCISIEEGIQEICYMHKIDLIAMLTHGRTGFAHFMRGSIAEDLSASAIIDVPILTIKNPKK